MVGTCVIDTLKGKKYEICLLCTPDGIWLVTISHELGGGWRAAHEEVVLILLYLNIVYPHLL